MTRLVDADALRENMQWCIDHGMYDKPYDYLAEIDDAPTIDAVEVVRCKDCKHYLNEHLCLFFSRHGTIETSSYAYCAYGERRKDGEA